MNIGQYPELPLLLSEALQKELPGARAIREIYPKHPRAAPAEGQTSKLSAVMVLLFPKQGEWHLLLIQRTEDGHAHSGQIGFPGGKKEPDDESLWATAIRETQEEVGLASSASQAIGPLSPLYISVSNFEVFPFLAHCPSTPIWTINPQEIQRTIEIPLSTLLDTKRKVLQSVFSPINAITLKDVRGYLLDDKSFIWGATAIMLKEFEIILREHIGLTDE